MYMWDIFVIYTYIRILDYKYISIYIYLWDLYVSICCIPPWKFNSKSSEKLPGSKRKVEKVVFQLPYFRGELLNLGRGGIWDYTTTFLAGECNKPLEGFLWTNRYNGNHKGFERCSFQLAMAQQKLTPEIEDSWRIQFGNTWENKKIKRPNLYVCVVFFLRG